MAHREGFHTATPYMVIRNAAAAMEFYKKAFGAIELGRHADPDGKVRHGEIKIGDRMEIYCSNLDMSTNCYDRYYIAKGNDIVDVWPIMGRSGAAQR